MTLVLLLVYSTTIPFFHIIARLATRTMRRGAPDTIIMHECVSIDNPSVLRVRISIQGGDNKSVPIQTTRHRKYASVWCSLMNQRVSELERIPTEEADYGMFSVECTSFCGERDDGTGLALFNSKVKGDKISNKKRVPEPMVTFRRPTDRPIRIQGPKTMQRWKSITLPGVHLNHRHPVWWIASTNWLVLHEEVKSRPVFGYCVIIIDEEGIGSSYVKPSIVVW